MTYAHWLQNGQLYQLLPMKCKTRLPDEGFQPMPIELKPGLTFDVYCEGPNRGKHRIFAVCHCGRHIPFGRMGQHYRKCKGG